MEAVEGYEEDIAVGGDARVSVIGVGGAGCRIVSDLFGRMSSVRTIAVNTDRKALSETQADARLYICKEVVKGAGTRGDALLGKKCARIHEAEIMAAVQGSDVAVVVAGMGGGTGSGAAAVVAELCDRVVKQVVSFAIMPFSFESSERREAARKGIADLRAVCRNVVEFQNDKALTVAGVRTLDDALKAMNASIADAIDTSVRGFHNTVRAAVQQAIAKTDDERDERADEEPVAVPVPY